MLNRRPIRLTGQLPLSIDQAQHIAFEPLWLKRLKPLVWGLPIFCLPLAGWLWQSHAHVAIALLLAAIAIARLILNCSASISISNDSIVLSKRLLGYHRGQAFSCLDLVTITICQRQRYQGNKRRRTVISLYPRLQFARPLQGSNREGYLSLANSLNSECFANDLEFFSFLQRLSRITNSALEIDPKCAPELQQSFKAFSEEHAKT